MGWTIVHERGKKTTAHGISMWDDVKCVEKAHMAMNRSAILQLLSTHLPDLQARYNVRRLALFGSAARDEMRPESDIDVLVEFDGPPTFDHYFDLRDALEKLLGRRVDLVTNQGLKPRARRHVEKDLIRVA